MLWTIRDILFAGFCLAAILQPGDLLAQSGEAHGSAAFSQLRSSSGLQFIPNRGQLSDQFGKPMPEVLYTLDGYGMKSYFTKGSMHYVFSKGVGHALACPKDWDKLKQHDRSCVPHDTLSLYRIDAKFIGSNPNAEIIASDTADDYTNYYLTNCPDGITHVPGFRKIVYRNIYPNIDLVLYTTGGRGDRATTVDKGTSTGSPNPINPNNPINHGSDNNPGSDNLEYDFVVHPGGDPHAIQISYDHATSISVDEEGLFHLASPYGKVVESKPNGYQLGADSRESIQCGFKLNGNNLSFETGGFDPSRDLYIDPQRLWGTYFGWHDTANETDLKGLAVDRAGNIDVTGTTDGTADIATSGSFQATYGGFVSDCYIAKFSPDGSLRWATYYGGSAMDYALAIACDSGKGMVITGFTTSTNAIATAGSYQSTFGGYRDAFLASFDSNGARRWGTYIRGVGVTRWFFPPALHSVPPSSGGSEGTSVAIDSMQNIIVAGFGSDSGMATVGAYKYLSSSSYTADDAFLAKFSSSGSLTWATYFGGDSAESETHICVDGSNNIYMSGVTESKLGIATAGAFQTIPGPFGGPAYFSKWSPSGALDWASFYLDSAYSKIYNLAAGRAGALYIVGATSDIGVATQGAFQTTYGGYGDGIIAKFSASGKRIWATYYGGTQNDELYGIVLDTSENIFASGYTTSPNGISSPGEYQIYLLGPWNAFMIKFDSGGHRHWGTYYGRRGWGTAIGLDRQGHPFMGGYTNTGGEEYNTPGAYDSVPYGYFNGFIAKFCDPVELRIASNVPDTDCPGTPVTLSTKPGLLSYQWLQNGAPIFGATSQPYSFQAPLIQGPYNYTVDAVGTDMCSTISDTVTLVVRRAPQITAPLLNTVCPGYSTRLLAAATGSGPLTYSWTPGATLDHPDSLQPIATPAQPTTYNLTVTDVHGCTTTKQVNVTFFSPPKVSAGGNRTACIGSPIAITATTTGSGPFLYSWSPLGGLDRTDTSTVLAAPTVNTTYAVVVTDKNGCSSKDSVFVIVSSPPKVSAGPHLSVCAGSPIKIGSSTTGGRQPYTFLWSPATGLSNRAIAQPTASPDSTTLYTILVTDKNGCSSVDSVLVTVSDSLIPTVTASGPLSICTGDTVHLTAGTGYSTYAWLSGEKTSAISVTKSGDYSVHVSNGSGCSGTSSAVAVTVLPDSVPRPALSATSTKICEGDSVQISPVGSYMSYAWSTGDTTPKIFARQSGSYSVTVTNSAGCSGTSAPFAITVVPTPVVTVTASGSDTLCSGDSLTLIAASGYAKYSWSSGDTTSSIAVKSSGIYSVTVTNAAGCSATSLPDTVTVSPVPELFIGGPAAVCPNATTTYVDSTNTFTVGDVFSWELTPAGVGTVTSSNPVSITVQWGAGGTATLIATEVTPSGCSATVRLVVTVSSNLTPIITANGPFAFCPGDSVTLDAGAGYSSYQWSKDGTPIAGATKETLSADQAGNYSVFVTASGGCSGTSVPSVATIYPTPAKPLITRKDSLLVSSAAKEYQWSVGGNAIPSATGQTIVPVSTGVYSVTITDANGCSSMSDPYSNFAAVTVSTSSAVVLPGDTVSILLKLDSANGLIESGAKTYFAKISLDSTMLTPINPAGVPTGKKNWILSLAGPVPNAPAVLQTISALAFGSGYCSNVTIDTFYFPGATLNVTTESGTVCLTGTCRPLLESSDTAFTIKRVFPNPSDGSFTIEYHVASDGPVSIYLEDYLGRNVQELKNEWSQPGDENETYSLEAIPSGVYRILLRSGARVLSAMIVLAR